MAPKHFEVREEHMKLLARLNIGWCDCEYGAPSVDPKRPYGNSDVETDMGEILGYTLPRDSHGEIDPVSMDSLRTLHEQMQTVLQILADNAGRGVRTGSYVQVKLCGPWVRAC